MGTRMARAQRQREREKAEKPKPPRPASFDAARVSRRVCCLCARLLSPPRLSWPAWRLGLAARLGGAARRLGLAPRRGGLASYGGSARQYGGSAQLGGAAVRWVRRRCGAAWRRSWCCLYFPSGLFVFSWILRRFVFSGTFVRPFLFSRNAMKSAFPNSEIRVGKMLLDDDNEAKCLFIAAHSFTNRNINAS